MYREYRTLSLRIVIIVLIARGVTASLTLWALPGLLTQFLIGSYHEMFTWIANYDEGLNFANVAPQTYTWDYFLTPSGPSLIGSIDNRIFILTNLQVVLTGLEFLMLFIKSAEPS